MTLDQLNEYFHLLEQLNRARQLLDSREAAAVPSASRLDGMPHAPGYSDRVGNLAAEITDMRASVEAWHEKVDRKRQEIAEYIETITDDLTRLIFRLRFLNGLSWKEVAGTIGGWNTESGVKAICYRYLRRKNEFKVSSRDKVL